MFSCTLQPAGDGSFAVVGAAHEYRDVTAFGQEHQDQNDTVFINLQSIEMGVQATGETFVTPLAFPVLDVFANTPFSVTDMGVQPVIGDAEV